jgi:hypothetical protein
MWFGGFYGSRPEVDQVALNSGGRAYGGFFHYLDQSPDKAFYSELVVGGIGEYQDGQVDREYLSLYGRQGSGSRWSLYENAEMDLNRDWRKDASSPSYQLSNLLFSGTYAFSRAVRIGASYDQRRRYRRLEDRETPESLFDDSLREGAQINAYLGSGRGLRANLSVGLRRRQGSTEDNLTYTGSVYHGNVLGWNLRIGADYSAFSGETSEGSRTGFRVQKFFTAGHDLEITVGSSTTTILLTGDERRNEWIRLSGTAQMGRHLFLLGEYEVSTGDDFQGKRLFVELGYRF